MNRNSNIKNVNCSTVTSTEMCNLLSDVTGDVGSEENQSASQSCSTSNASNASAAEDAASRSSSPRGAVTVIVCSVVGASAALCIGATVCVGLVIGCGKQNLNKRRNQGKKVALAW